MSLYVPVHCLARVDVEDASVVARVHERLLRMGAQESGSWAVTLSLLHMEPRPGGATPNQRYLRVTDDSLSDPLIMHVASHVPLVGELDALNNLLPVSTKPMVTIKGKRWTLVDEDETDWEVAVGASQGNAGPKNVLFLSFQLSATRSRTSAPLWMFQKMCRAVVGAELAAKAAFVSHQQPAAVSPLVASTMYNRAHLTLQYVSLLQADLKK